MVRRASRFRAGRPRVPLAERLVVVLDDGLATRSTTRAAYEVVRAEGASRVVLAVPVAPGTGPRDWRVMDPADARATETGARGELNVGQLERAEWPADSLFVGFTTHHGTDQPLVPRRSPGPVRRHIHIEHTTAVEPLGRTTSWADGEPPETFPTGLQRRRPFSTAGVQFLDCGHAAAATRVARSTSQRHRYQASRRTRL